MHSNMESAFCGELVTFQMAEGSKLVILSVGEILAPKGIYPCLEMSQMTESMLLASSR